jgi:hypothetical protein
MNAHETATDNLGNLASSLYISGRERVNAGWLQ